MLTILTPLIEWVPGTGQSAPLQPQDNLAMGYRAAGRTAEAIPLLERTLADFERLLGPDHPNTNVVRENLATLTDKSAHSDGK